MIVEQIEKKIREAFSPLVLEVENESYRHNVPAGSESHVRLHIVSEAFKNTTLINRHKKLYALLHEEMNSGIHALQMQLDTPEEWERKAGKIASPPDCRGGGR